MWKQNAAGSEEALRVRAIARLLAPGGTPIITTPNLLTSDKINPWIRSGFPACSRAVFSTGSSPREHCWFEEASRAAGQGMPDATIDDFPIGAADPGDIDLIAICRKNA